MEILRLHRMLRATSRQITNLEAEIQAFRDRSVPVHAAAIGRNLLKQQEQKPIECDSK
jgi:hypothetical protein